MKRTLLVALSLCTSVSMMAQGWVLFQNKNANPALDAAVKIKDTAASDARNPAAADGIKVELWGGTKADSLALLTGTNPSNPSAVPIMASITGAYFAGKSWSVTGIPAGVDAFFKIKAYSATHIGESEVFSIKLTEPPATPAVMVGLKGFNLVPIPEPSILALGVLGMGAFLLRRRS